MKDLYIISDRDGLEYVNRILKKKHTKKQDLISYLNIENEVKYLEDFFEEVYDLSNYTNEEISRFLIENVLDITFDYKLERKYDSIYLYENGLNNSTLPIKHYKNDYYWDNISYGHSNSIKNYCNFEETIHLIIEHGNFFNHYFVGMHEKNNKYPGIITTGDFRFEQMVTQTQKHIIRIGPYINYATNLYSDKFMKHIKEKFGKTLLVFPTHSVGDRTVEYDINKFIEYIKKFSEEYNFESILICMYCVDVNLGIDKNYREEGFTIVSCGNYHCPNKAYDYEYLNKLKTLINLSDYVMSNDIGSYLGYSVFLNKPCNIFSQDILLKNNKSNDIKYNKIDNERLTYFINLFSYPYFYITEQQYNMCDIQWGFSHIKTKEEMEFILEFYNEAYNYCKSQIKDNMSDNQVSEIYNNYINKKLLSTNHKLNYLIKNNYI